MEGFWARLDKQWNEHVAFRYGLPVAGIALVVWARFKPQSPGVSIGLLALAAGIMSVRRMLPAEKFAWVAILIAFTVLEVRAIKESDAENRGVRESQNAKFQEIATGLQTSISQGMSQYQSTISHVDGVLKTTQDVAATAKQDLVDVTGGNRVAVLKIIEGLNQKDVGTAFIFVPDRGIVRNVQVRIVNLTLFDRDVKEAKSSRPTNIFAHDVDLDVGDIGFGEGRTMSASIPLGPGDEVHFNIFFGALNGMWLENLFMRKKNGYWVEACRVFRKKTKLTSLSSRDVVYEQIEKGFLEKGERMNWAVASQ